jgi:hypothetical protein
MFEWIRHMVKRAQTDIADALAKVQTAVVAQTTAFKKHAIKSDPEVLSRLDVITTMLNLILKNQGVDMATQADIAAALAKVTADVAAQTTVEASFVTYAQGLSAQIAALSAATTDTTTAAALLALSTQIETNTAADSAAMVVNTPAAGP